MPPKGKKNVKKKNKAKLAIDDINTSVLSRKNLEEFCLAVNEDLTKGKLNSEFLRLDRDKLINMIAISEIKLKIYRNRNRQIIADIRNADEEHSVAMTLHRQRITHLKNELEGKKLDHKMDSKKFMSEERDSQKEIATEIINDIETLKRNEIQMENNFNQCKVEIEKKHAQNVHNIREEEKQMQVISEINRDKIAKEMSAQLQRMFSAEYRSLVTLKDKHYRRFMDEHAKRTKHLKYYYNRIIEHNDEVMQNLKMKMEDLKESAGQVEKQYLHLNNEKIKVTEELSRLDKEKNILLNKLLCSDQHKLELRNAKEKLQENKRCLLDLKVENDVLQIIKEKYFSFQEEEDKQVTTLLFKCCYRAQRILVVIEFFVLHLFYSLKEINAHLNEIKSIYGKKGKTHNLLETVNDYNDNSLDTINYEIAELADKRNTLFRTYKSLLKKYKIPFHNTGFIHIRFEDLLKRIDNPRMIVNENRMVFQPVFQEIFPL